MKQMKRFLSVALILLVAMAALTACGKSKDPKSIDCKEFINVTIKGFEGSGKPSYEMNSSFAQDRDYMDKMFPDLIRSEAEDELEKIYKQLKITAEPMENLKNGDTVTITVDATDAKLLTDRGISLKNASFTTKVEGLGEGTAFDPFEGLEVVFSGYDGIGDVHVNSSSASEMAQKYGYFDHDYDVHGKLKNGDTFTVVYKETFEGRMLADKVVATPTEKTYTVSGLEAYKSINPFDYYNLEFKGYDGKGTARLSANYDKEAPSSFWLCDATVTPNEDLKNGDKVTLKFEVGSIDLSRYGITLSTTTKEVTVEGLEDMEEIDPFTDDIIVFMGKSPMVQVEINKDKLPEGTKSYFTYYVNGENRYNKMTFEDGEEVTFTVEVSEYLEKKGYTVKETEKKIKAKGEGAYITEPDDVKEMLEDPKETVIPAVKALEGAYQSQWMGTMKEFEDLKLVKVLYFTLKEDERTQLGNYNRPCFNRVLFVYEVEGTFDRNSDVNHYVGFTYTDFEVNKEGEKTFKEDDHIEVARELDRLLSVYKMSDSYYTSQDLEYLQIDKPEPTEPETEEETTEEATEEETEEVTEEATEEATEEETEESTEDIPQ